MDSSPLSSLSEPNVASPTPSSPAAEDGNIVAADSPTAAYMARRASPKQKAVPKGKKKIIVRRPAKKSKWDAETIITDPRSPLATADLRSILSNPMAWDVLDAADRAEILSLFPDGEHVLDAGTPSARPDILSLRNDDTFRYDCAAYTENIAEGRFDPGWLECAWSAHERRKIGDFDEYLAEKFEEDWGVELPEEYKPKRQGVKKEEEGVPAAQTQATEERNGESPEAMDGVVHAADENGIPSKEDDSEKPSLSDHEALMKPQNCNGNSGHEAIQEEREEEDNSPNADKEVHSEDHKADEAMIIDELQGDGDIKMRRTTPTPLKRKRRLPTRRGEDDSEDELA